MSSEFVVWIVYSDGTGTENWQGRMMFKVSFNLAFNHPAHKGCWYLTMPEGNGTFS